MTRATNSKRLIVLVSGASSGIGRACAERMTARGRLVYGASRTEPAGAGWQHLRMDVTSETSVGDAVGQLLQREGRIDALVHSAGVSLCGPFEETSLGEAQRHFEVNYFGAVRLMRAVLPIMRRQGHGKLLLIGSIGGLIGLRYLGHYSASKFALDGLLEAVRPEIAPFGIDATVIHPGDINTPFATNGVVCAATQPGSPYYASFSRINEMYKKAEAEARGPESLASKVDRLLDRRRLPTRIVAGTAIETLGVLAKNALPSRLFEMVMGRIYGP